MSKVFGLILIFVAIYAIDSVPVPDNSFPAFKNIPINTDNFAKAIMNSFPNMDVMRLNQDNGAGGMTSSMAAVSRNGHGRLFVSQDGKSYEKSFRK